MKRGERKIDRYLDALAEVSALSVAITLEGNTDERSRLLQQAKVRVTERMRVLTGGQLGQAHRLIRARAADAALEADSRARLKEVGCKNVEAPTPRDIFGAWSRLP
jgi:hypothetical protein